MILQLTKTQVARLIQLTALDRRDFELNVELAEQLLEWPEDDDDENEA